MRIVHTVPHVCKEASGPSYSVSRLCEELGAKYHRVRLLTIDERARRDARSARQAHEEQRMLAEEEKKDDVVKKGNMNDFYSNLLKSNIAMGRVRPPRPSRRSA